MFHLTQSRLAIAFALGLGGGALLAYAAKIQVRPDTPAVAVNPNIQTPVRFGKDAQTSSDSYIGVILPNESVQISAEIDGAVSQLLVSVGSQVAKGTPLAILNPPDSAASEVRVAEADVAAAASDLVRLQIVLQQSEAELRRAEVAREQQLIAVDKFESAQYQVKLAAAAVVSGQNEVALRTAVKDQRLLAVSRAVPRAPFSGLVAARYIGVGEIVRKGAPLMRIVQNYPLHLRFAIPAADRMLLQRGTQVMANFDDTPKALFGNVDSIAPEVDTAADMLFVEAILKSITSERDDTVVGRTAIVKVVRGR